MGRVIAPPTWPKAQRKRTSALDIASFSDIWLRGGDWTLDGSNKVQQWFNRGTLGAHPDATEATNRPSGNVATLNGHPGARGNGSNTRLVFGASGLTLGTSQTLTLVCTKPSGLMCIVGLDNQSGVIANFSGNALVWFADGNHAWTATASGAHILTVTHTDAGTTTLYYDGVQVYSGAASTNYNTKILGTLLCRCSGTPTASNDLFSDGDIFEVIHAPSILAAGTLSSLHTTLKTYYGL
jgi:hypothetical protein